MNVHFSSKSDEWETPREVFEQLNAEFGPFDVDVAASFENRKCENYFDIAEDGLNTPWERKNWCNPPYSSLKKWIAKASEEQKKGNLTVMLIPARTDTIAFHQYIYNKPNVETRFIKSRLRFVGAKKLAPFPSMIVIFKPL